VVHPGFEAQRQSIREAPADDEVSPTPHIETMFASRLRAAHSLSRQCALARRSFASTARQLDSAVPTTAKEATPPQVAGEAPLSTPVQQAPNRSGVWSRSQKPRSEAMTGPRFEQTDYSMQVGNSSPNYHQHKQDSS